MASAVAKRSDHRVTRSASWSVMHSDEDLARILQMQEEKEYQDHLAAKEVQCQNDHQLARLLSGYDGHLAGPTDVDESRNSGHQTRRHMSTRSVPNSTTVDTSSPNATVISITDSDTDFSDCFEDSTFDELSNAVERAQDEAERITERQDAADALARDDEIAEALQNDEQLNRMIESELESSGSIGGAENAFSRPVGASPSVRNSSPISTDPEVLNRRNETMGFSRVGVGSSEDWTDDDESAVVRGLAPANNALKTSVNIAWNVVGSAVHWVSGLFSGAQPHHPQSNVDNRVTTSAEADVEEEDDEEEEEEEECCEEDDGWEEEESEDFDDFGDDFDDEEADFDMMDSDMEYDSDEENSESLVGFHNDDGIVGRGRGLALEEIDVLPTCRFQSRPLQTKTTATTGAAASAGANEHQCQNECQVCLSSFADGDVLRTLPCCHQFHSECIDVWLQRNAICPVCRVRIRDEIGC